MRRGSFDAESFEGAPFCPDASLKAGHRDSSRTKRFRSRHAGVSAEFRHPGHVQNPVVLRANDEVLPVLDQPAKDLVRIRFPVHDVNGFRVRLPLSGQLDEASPTGQTRASCYAACFARRDISRWPEAKGRQDADHPEGHPVSTPTPARMCVEALTAFLDAAEAFSRCFTSETKPRRVMDTMTRPACAARAQSPDSVAPAAAPADLFVVNKTVQRFELSVVVHLPRKALVRRSRQQSTNWTALFVRRASPSDAPSTSLDAPTNVAEPCSA